MPSILLILSLSLIYWMIQFYHSIFFSFLPYITIGVSFFCNCTKINKNGRTRPKTMTFCKNKYDFAVLDFMRIEYIFVLETAGRLFSISWFKNDTQRSWLGNVLHRWSRISNFVDFRRRWTECIPFGKLFRFYRADTCFSFVVIAEFSFKQRKSTINLSVDLFNFGLFRKFSWKIRFRNLSRTKRFHDEFNVLFWRCENVFCRWKFIILDLQRI